MIQPNINNIIFYWDGPISPSRRKILEDCIYSTRVFNPDRPIYLVSKWIKDLDPKFNIEIIDWDDSIFEGVHIPLLEKYKVANYREMSDLMRIILLYKFGGSYVDTDDLCIKTMPTEKNIVCRSYDPHTAHYNNLKFEDCINGIYREIKGYDHITIFPRNDCWLNFEPRSKFISDILNNPKYLNSQKVIYIGDGFSWQSLTLETCLKNINEIGTTFNLGLTLLYLYEDFVSASSYHDRCMFGGEMCDEYEKLPGIKDVEWGFYKCDEKTALDFYKRIYYKYPYLSHMWLHSKDDKKEWLLDNLTDEKYSISTWIYNYVKNKINDFRINSNI